MQSRDYLSKWIISFTEVDESLHSLVRITNTSFLNLQNWFAARFTKLEDRVNKIDERLCVIEKHLGLAKI